MRPRDFRTKLNLQEVGDFGANLKLALEKFCKCARVYVFVHIYKQCLVL